MSRRQLLLTTRGSDMVASLLRMQLLEDDGEAAYVDDSEAKQKEADARPAWMRLLHNSGRTWRQLLPKTLQVTLSGRNHFSHCKRAHLL